MNMKQLAVIAAFSLLLPLAAGQTAARRAKPKSASASLQAALVKLIDEYAEAAKKGDAGFFQTNLARDYIGIEADGHTSTKPEVLDLVGSGKIKLESLQVKTRSVRTYGMSAVVVSELIIRGTVGTTELEGTYISTRVLEKTSNGQWESVLSQLTKVQ